MIVTANNVRIGDRLSRDGTSVTAVTADGATHTRITIALPKFLGYSVTLLNRDTVSVDRDAVTV